MLRSNFQRVGGLNFELVKAGRQTMLWKVSKEGKLVRFETWDTYRGAGDDEFDEEDNRTFGSLASAEKYFNKHENN